MQDSDGRAIIGVGGNASSITPGDRIGLTDLGAVYSETGTHGSAEGGSIVRRTPYSTKRFGRYDSMTFPQYGNGVRLDNERLILSKVGAVKLVLHRPIEGTPKTVTLTRSAPGKWYACLSCETEAHLLEPTKQITGVDVGLMSFATLSNGEQIENPRFYRRDEADLKRVQKRKDAAKKAENWPENAKQKKVLSKIHERIGNRCAKSAHKRSRELVNQYQVIVFEDLAPQEMGKSRGMRKSIMDVAWTQFISMTVGKAAEAGRTVILIDPRNTSKMCSQCGEKVEKKLSERTHTCPHCGLVMDRDTNAALNILQRGLRTLRLYVCGMGRHPLEAQAFTLGSRHWKHMFGARLDTFDEALTFLDGLRQAVGQSDGGGRRRVGAPMRQEARA